MEKIVCFIIGSKILDLEQVLVEYDRVPILFLCKCENKRYLCLCGDMDDLTYYVVRISPKNLFNLLHGKIPMRDAFLLQEKYWEIRSGETPDQDVVEEKSIMYIDREVLPVENAYYEVLSQDVKEYVKRFDTEFLVKEYTRSVIAETSKIILQLGSARMLSRRIKFIDLCQMESEKTDSKTSEEDKYSINGHDLVRVA